MNTIDVRSALGSILERMELPRLFPNGKGNLRREHRKSSREARPPGPVDAKLESARPRAACIVEGFAMDDGSCSCQSMRRAMTKKYDDTAMWVRYKNALIPTRRRHVCVLRAFAHYSNDPTGYEECPKGLTECLDCAPGKYAMYGRRSVPTVPRDTALYGDTRGRRACACPGACRAMLGRARATACKVCAPGVQVMMSACR